MSTSYYYLVSGLPDLALDETRPLPGTAEFLAEAAESLDSADLPLLRVLQYPYDNTNLITLLENRDRRFDPRGNFSQEELAAEIKNPSSVPPYMEDFLAAYREGRQLYAHLNSEDQLAWLFYDSVRGHPNVFVREWFGFEQNLRNLLAAINCRELAGALQTQSAELLDKAIIGSNEVADRLRRSSAPDFSLPGILREIDLVLSFPRDQPAEFEKQVDLLRLRVLEELVFLRGFKIDAVLAFVVKLNIVWRWRDLDAAKGRQTLDALVDELKAGLVVSQLGEVG